MAVLSILTYPDPRLREECQTVAEVAAAPVQALIDDLLETMRANPGCVGVAASQTGQPLRVVVIDCGRARKPAPDLHGELVLCNPEIIAWQGMEVAREGCLSLPDYTGNVVRATRLTVRFQDRQGAEQRLELAGFEARVVQHELDHLDGVLFIDRLVSRKADLFLRRSSAK